LQGGEETVYKEERGESGRGRSKGDIDSELKDRPA